MTKMTKEQFEQAVDRLVWCNDNSPASFRGVWHSIHTRYGWDQADKILRAYNRIMLNRAKSTKP